MTAAAAGDFSAAEPADSQQGFADAVSSLKTRSQLPTADRVFRLVGPVFMPLGILVIFLGWLGAANTTRVFLQIPYLISGGLVGLALVFAGGFLYFTRWITDMNDDNRRHALAAAETAQRTAEALERIEGLLAAGALIADRDAPSAASMPTAPIPVVRSGEHLVATRKGSLAHRADCSLVVGRDTVPVEHGAEMDACQICRPGE